jgi:hypothetical protein
MRALAAALTAVTAVTLASVAVSAQTVPPHTPAPVTTESTPAASPVATSTATPGPSATPAPPVTYAMVYGPGSCDTFPDQAICHLAAPTLANPKPWVTLLPAPAAVPPTRTPAPVVPLVYTSTDGYHWTLRLGRPW